MIGKPNKNGMRDVHVYDPAIKRKRYVGRRKTVRECQLLEAAKTLEFAGPRNVDWTIEQFAEKFLSEYHGPNTKRPEPTTKTQNEHNLRAFRLAHGGQLMSSISRDAAHKLRAKRPNETKTIAAMFAVAVDIGALQTNPFVGHGIARSRGRSDIDPLTEAEVERLAEIALTTGAWGPELWAIVLWMGWTGMRPGEVCALDCGCWDDDGIVRVEWNMRNDGTLGPTKGKQQRDIVVAPEAAAAARTLSRTSGHLFLSPTGKPLRPNSLRHYWIPVRTAFTAELDRSHWLRRRLMKDPTNQLDPYELRHHCGSMLADRGLSARDIAAHLGNSAKVCEETYIHDYEDRQRDRIRAAMNRPAADADRADGQTLGRRAP
jgi:integrase